MSKDYRYQREEWDSVDDEDGGDYRKDHKRQQSMKDKKKAMHRRDKQRRVQHDSFEWAPNKTGHPARFVLLYWKLVPAYAYGRES